jgi:predicted phosphoadenosine phosphosulfate sulfurtransferase
MPQIAQGKTVLARALERLEECYANNRRVVVGISGGKDSTVVLNLAVRVADKLGKLPVEASFLDEEIMYPGVPEYLARVLQRTDVKLHWFANHCPQVNAFSRAEPFWWTFDPRLPEDQWVRRPPPEAEWITDNELYGVITPRRFPPPEGADLIAVLGIRAAESRNRRMSIFSSGGFLSKVNQYGHRTARPIFDWTDGDVWKLIHDEKLDHADTYHVMYRLGVSRSRLRIGPPTMTVAAVSKLQMAAKAWPKWLDLVAARLHGIRTAAKFGRRAVTAQRHLGETWQQCYQRVCIDEAPAWLVERARAYAEVRQRQHSYHSSEPLPDSFTCSTCYANGSWKLLVKAMYMGDPFALTDRGLELIQPEQFRPGAGYWWTDSAGKAKTRK